MASGSTPSIAAIGIIGEYDNPLHIALFPPHENELIELSLVLNGSLDIFDIRLKNNTLNQDLGLLHAVDERIATYGWLTNTGIKFIIAVDMLGRPQMTSPEPGRGVQPVIGLRDAELRPAFKAIHTAYIKLLMDPFYTPEERTPIQTMNATGRAAEITSKKFINEIQRVGRAWYPGIAVI